MTMMMMVSYFRKFNYNALLGVCCVTCGCVHGTLWSDRRLLWPSLVYVVLEELLEDVKNLSIKCTPELEEYIYLSMGVGIHIDLVFLSYKILLQQHDNGQIFVATIMTKRQYWQSILILASLISKPDWLARFNFIII